MNTITGYFGGTMWNESTRKFDIKTLGEKDNGAILCGLNVSSKDKDGNRVYGKPVDVKINIKSADEGKRVYELIASGDSMLSMEGFFVANNWTNKEGKEIKGNQYLVTDSTKVVKANSAPKQAPKKEPESEPWDA
jgi:hypothetical protein